MDKLSIGRCIRTVPAIAALLACISTHAQTYPLPSACATSGDTLWTSGDVLADSLLSWKIKIDTDNPAGVTPLPLHHVLVPESQRNGSPIKHIVAFGDMHGTDRHVPPQVSADVQTLFKRADLVLGNLEAPITDGPQALMGGTYTAQNWNFHMTRDYLTGFAAQLCVPPRKAVFSVANNHANDHDRWTQTLASIVALNDLGQGFRFTGVDLSLTGTNDPYVVEVSLDTMKIGVMGWAHFANTQPPSTGFPWLTDKRVMYTPNGEPKTGIRDFTAFKQARNLQLLIGMPHWDCQVHAYPDPRTVTQATQMMQKGLDLILGSHQANLQPANTKTWQTAGGQTRQSLVFYGLGHLFIGTGDVHVPELSIATEILVDSTGRILEYILHPLVRRTLPQDNTASPDGYRRPVLTNTQACGYDGAQAGTAGAELITLAAAKQFRDNLLNDPDYQALSGKWIRTSAERDRWDRYQLIILQTSKMEQFLNTLFQ